MKKLFWGILLVHVLIRLIHIDMPLLEGAATRQIYNAMVAKTFFEERLNLFYPRMYINGNHLYYSALEFQFIPYLAAIFYKLAGGVYPVVFRLISILFTALSLGMLYRFAEALVDRKTALTAMAVLGCSPISIYLGRAAHFEMPMIFFNIAALYYFYKWTLNESMKDAWLAYVCFIFAVLLKIPNLYLLLPMAFLALSKWGWRAIFKNWGLWVSLLVILAGYGWLHYLQRLGPHYHFSHFDLAFNLKRMALMYGSVEFYKILYQGALDYVLTPVGLTLLIVGMCLKQGKPSQRLLYYWLPATGVCLLLLPEQFGRHSYYHIHYLPVAAVFMARGFWGVVDRCKTDVWGAKPYLLAFVLGGSFMILCARYAIPFYTIPHQKSRVIQSAEIVKRVVPKDALIISSVDSPASLLYYADRRGWPVDFSDKGERAFSMLETFRQKGAQYLVFAHKQDLAAHPAWRTYLRQHYLAVFENDYCLIFDLQEKI